MPAEAIRWTPEQRAAITTVGQSLLVSAAAGSGKTAVLAERCAYLVCEAKDVCDVDDLLVVTFTEAAAAEMRARIQRSLRDRYASRPSPRLAAQLALVDRAQISTLHGFCARLLRQNFNAAGIDPGFRILDPSDAGLLRADIARDVIRDAYDAADPSGFRRLVESYAETDDTRINELLIKTHATLCSLASPEQWLQASRGRLLAACDGTLEKSELGTELRTSIHSRLQQLEDRAQATLGQLQRLGDFPGYLQYVSNLRNTVAAWNRALEERGLEGLQAALGCDLGRLPRRPSVENAELAKALVEELRGELNDERWREPLRFTPVEWRDGLKAIIPHAQLFFDLVETFSKRYAAAKEAIRSLDFADLERLTLRVLSLDDSGGSTPSDIATGCHRRFKHVLVDEYQDINELQESILRLVSRECLAERQAGASNLFCVGDVKQSIYRFRLAEPNLFLRRQQGLRLPGAPGKVIDLQSNFRSRGPLLEAINGIFERLMTAEAADINYDKTHRLVAGRVFPTPNLWTNAFHGAPIELHLLPAKLQVFEPSDEADEEPAGDELDRTQREAAFVARRIRQLLGLDPGSKRMHVADASSPDGSGMRPARFSDVVILLRSMKFKAEQFSRALDAAGIPVHAETVTGYFDAMEVRDMLALLSVLDNRQQDIPLVTLLRSPLAHLPSADDAMARIRLAYPARGDGDVPFHLAVDRYADEQDDALAACLRDLRHELDRWRSTAQRRPLDELIWTIFQESGFLAFCEGLTNGAQRVANLLYLHERASEFATFQRQGLSRFMRFLRSLEDDTDLGLPSTSSRAQDVVRIMSIHRSKGLEYPIVILPDLGKRINLKDADGPILIDRRLGLGMSVVDLDRKVRYPSLASTLVESRLRQQTLAEELRVVYVAMTRAKEHLILVGSAGENAWEKYQSRWGGHAGAFAAEMVLSARSILDWVAPVAAATRGLADRIIEVSAHGSESLREIAFHDRSAKATGENTALAELRPLADPPDLTPDSRAVIERLEFCYAFESLSASPAVRSVTGQRLDPDREPPADPAPIRSDQPFLERKLDRPRFLMGGAPLSAAERGTATHLVLQHLDFAIAKDEADVAALIDQLVTRHSMTKAEACAVDVTAIGWLLRSEVGDLLRRHSGVLRREIPIYFPESIPAGLEPGMTLGPLDRTMVRGRLDLLVPLSDGNIIIDYKTDAVEPSAVPSHAQKYLPQLYAYSKAIEQITRQPVTAIQLVYLTARTAFTI